MTNNELTKKFVSLELRIGGQHDGYLTMQEDDAKECTKIAIDFAIEQLREASICIDIYVDINLQSAMQKIIDEQIQSLEKQKEELNK
jgi:hypothetical protein